MKHTCAGPMKAPDVVMLMRPGREKLLERWKNGEVPSDFLYGFCEMKESKMDIDLKVFAYPIRPSRLFAFFWSRFNNVISSFCLSSLYIGVAFSLWKSIRTVPVVITNIDSIGLSIAVLRIMFPCRFQHIHISQGLTNSLDERSTTFKKKEGLHLFLKKGFTSQLLGIVEKIIVLGVGAKKSMIEHGLVRNKQIQVIQYGVDFEFWGEEFSSKQQDGDSYVLSVGSDAGRDYESLLQCRLETRVEIVSRLPLSTTEGFVQRSNLTDKELRDLYLGSKFVVIPLKNISQPSGQSVCLQAMACGKAVLITKTIGFWDDRYFKDGANVFFVAPNNQNELQEKLAMLERNGDVCEPVGSKAKELVQDRFGIQVFASELGTIVRQKLQEGMQRWV